MKYHFILFIVIVFFSCNAYTQPTITDVDGNIYETVTIGSQLWMKENLKTTKFNNGLDIPLVTDNTIWKNLTTPAFCWYNNEDSMYNAPYGALYNWYSVNTGVLCPTGWKVPSDEDWDILNFFLGGIYVAGGKLKEAGTDHWSSPNVGASNETGFTALPSGQRASSAAFGTINYVGLFWTSTIYEPDNEWAWYRSVQYDNALLTRSRYLNIAGFAVRCIKESSSSWAFPLASLGVGLRPVLLVSLPSVATAVQELLRRSARLVHH
jgi:uncharacterized protein (TIGR02145 family)